MMELLVGFWTQHLMDIWIMDGNGNYVWLAYGLFGLGLLLCYKVPPNRKKL